MAQDPPRSSAARFAGLLGAELLGTLNDHLFLGIAAAAATVRFDLVPRTPIFGIVALVLPLSFVVLAGIAGVLSDRLPKRHVLIASRIPEALAVAALVPALGSGDARVLVALWCLMTARRVLFAPAKYGLVPEVVPRARLSVANGLLEAATGVGMAVGAIAGPRLWATFDASAATAGLVLGGVAAAGALSAWAAPSVPAVVRPEGLPIRPLAGLGEAWRTLRRDAVSMRVVSGIAYFGFVGAMLLTLVPRYGSVALGRGEDGVGFALALAAAGVAGGAAFAGFSSGGRVELGLIPLGAIGLAAFTVDLAWVGGRASSGLAAAPLRAGVDLFGIGAAAATFVVPLQAMLQQRAPRDVRGRVIALSHVAAALAMLFAGLATLALERFAGFDVQRSMVVAVAATLSVSAYVVWLLPDALVRFVLWLVTHTVYRIEVVGENSVRHGGALVVANHVSWVDAFLIGAATDRMVRFLMFRPYYEAPGLTWFFRRMHVIPVAAGDSEELKEQSLRRARDEVAAGHVVCIFAEGSITRTGNLLKFKRGFERIATRGMAPIVPVYLDGVWGSLFSWERGRLLFKLPRHLRYPVRVVFGEPMPSASRAHEVRGRMQELSATAIASRVEGSTPLGVRFEAVCRRRRSAPFAFDREGVWSFERWFDRAASLAAEVRARANPARRAEGGVAVLSPPGPRGAAAVWGVILSGRPVVMLDPDRGTEDLARQCELAGVGHVVADPEHLHAVGATVAFRRCAVETISLAAGSPARGARLPPPVGSVDDVAIVLFSRDREDRPRAVELTHRNVLAAHESLRQVFRLTRRDRVLGALPFSEAIGVIGTVVLPGLVGFSILYVGEGEDDVADRVRATPPTVVPVPTGDLERWAEALGGSTSVRHVLALGGPVAPERAVECAHAFGTEPLAGAGFPECAAMVSMNTPAEVRGEHGQDSSRAGTLGQPLPGIAVRIVGDDGRVLAPGEAGSLEVRGVNVMRGYRGDEPATRAAIVDGWFRTGMRAAQDDDGFLTPVSPEGDVAR